MITKKTFSMLIITIALFSNLVVGQSQLSKTLSKIRNELKNGNITNALDLFDEASENPELLKEEEIKIQEVFLWDRAMTHLDFSNKLTNTKQYIIYAEKAYEYWRTYILWYNALSPVQRETFPRENQRIKMAVAFMGNSIIRMSKPEILFDEFVKVPDPTFFGTNAFDLWKSWLYALPNYRPITSAERTTSLRNKLICDENSREKWRDYADMLQEWTEVERLTTTARKSYLRESAQIINVYENCAM